MAEGTRVLRSYECVLNLSNTSVGGSPTYVTVPLVQNLTRTAANKESDVSVRGAGGFELSAATLMGVQIECNIPYVTGDPIRLILENAAFNKSVIGVAASDGNITSNGTVSFVADCQVFGCTNDESIDKTADQKYVIKPTLSLLANGTPVAPSLKTT